MPSTVQSLFAAAATQSSGAVPWRARIPPPTSGKIDTGVYVVALSGTADSTEGALSICPISRAALVELLRARPELTVDGERPDAAFLGSRLAGFWCPDEVVLYVGLAGTRRSVTVSALSDRVQQYYITRLGARSPHAGGWPLKTLSNLDSLHVHYAYCDDVETRERTMLDAFAACVSDETRAVLYDTSHVMPFANLEDASGGRKRHGIRGARAPRKSSAQKPASAMPTQRVPVAPVSTAQAASTQGITARDIEQGIIRVPRPTKALFPPEPAYVEVDLRGERKSCRWDPRHSLQKQRSGVLGIGKALMDCVKVGESLHVRVEGDIYHLD